ncbi:MAG: HEAT repeat domain-containing protein [Actinobacteria bacterium]|nr:MAG: HEAT repeat domain-containing protein [Actinomycetota bacterium]
MKRLIVIVLVLAFTLGCSGKFEPLWEREYWTGGRRFESTWRESYRPELPHEPELDDPLIAAGSPMVLAVCEAVEHADTKYRRYALGALGFIGDRRALPTLQRILDDPSELDYIREDALQAIYQIDETRGMQIALRYRNDAGLSDMAKAVLACEPWLKEPSEE